MLELPYDPFFLKNNLYLCSRKARHFAKAIRTENNVTRVWLVIRDEKAPVCGIYVEKERKFNKLINFFSCENSYALNNSINNE